MREGEPYHNDAVGVSEYNDFEAAMANEPVFNDAVEKQLEAEDDFRPERLEEVYPKLASPASARSASVISFYKDLIKRKYPKTKFSIVGAKGGVSNGTPWNRGWPRPVGHATKRLKEAP